MGIKKYCQKIWGWRCLYCLLLFSLLCSASPSVYVLFFFPPISAQAAETAPSATSPLRDETVTTLPPASISPREIKLDADVSAFIQNRIDRGFDTASAQLRDHFTFLLTIIGIVNTVLLSVFSIFTTLRVNSAGKDAQNARKDAEKAHDCAEEAEKLLKEIRGKKNSLEEFEIENRRNTQGEEIKPRFRQGVKLYGENKRVEAIAIWDELANQGYALAQCSLAFCYENGYGVSQDQAKSVECYIKAAD